MRGIALPLIILLFSTVVHAVDRPPQFVNLAFDGSKSLKMWQRTLEFAEQENIKFTYFISGVYFLSNGDASFYSGPRRRAGRSDIPWISPAQPTADYNRIMNRLGHQQLSQSSMFRSRQLLLVHPV